MKRLTCTTKTKTSKNIIKKYVLLDLDTNEKIEAKRRDIVAMLRDRENYEITNLKLTYNNRVTHKGPLNTKAKSIVED